MNRIITSCLLAVMLMGLFNSQAPAVTKEELITKIAAREQNIKTLKGKFTLKAEYLTAEGKKEKFEKLYNWIIKDKMQKVTDEFIYYPEGFNESFAANKSGECIAKFNTSKVIWSFDGEITKQLIVDMKQGIIYPGVPQTKTPADWLLLRWAGTPLSAFLKQRDVAVTYEGQKKLGTKTCQVLAFTKDQESSGKLYLSDANGLAPIRFETLIKGKSSPDTRGVHTFSRLIQFDGIWLPQEMIITVYNNDPDREQIVMKETIVANDVQVNIEIPRDDVILTFPAGTLVHDSILGIVYKEEP